MDISTLNQNTEKKMRPQRKRDFNTTCYWYKRCLLHPQKRLKERMFMPVPNGASPAEQQEWWFSHREAVFEPKPSSSSFISPCSSTGTAMPPGPQVRMATLDSGEELLRKNREHVSTEELRLAKIRPWSSHLKTFCGVVTEELPIWLEHEMRFPTVHGLERPEQPGQHKVTVHSANAVSTWCSWGQCHPAPSPREDSFLEGVSHGGYTSAQCSPPPPL